MKSKNLIFKFEGEAESEGYGFALVYTFNQYLILENGGDVVQGILTTYKTCLRACSYQGHPCLDGCHDSNETACLKLFDSEVKKEISDAMSESGITLLDSTIVYHSSFNIPSWHLYETHGDLEEVMRNELESEVHWSLHVFG